VAKLWKRDSAPDASPHKRLAHGTGSRRTVLGGIVILAVLAGIVGAWQLADDGDGRARRDGGSWSMNPYLEAARDAQHAADRAREQMEAAAFEAETGNAAHGSTGYFQSGVDTLDLDLDRLAAELNAVSEVTVVELSGADLEAAVRQCARFTDRYFKALRFGAAEVYPVRAPATEPHVAGELDGRFRCEGDRGTVYTHSKPRSRDGLSACWRKQEAGAGGTRKRSGDALKAYWVEMKWDAEIQGWSIYSRADQRAVDRGRLDDARERVGADLERTHGRRAGRARERFPALVARIEELREDLRIAASEDLRREHARALREDERALRDALLDLRYTWLCKVAAGAALDARQSALKAATSSR